MNLLGRADRWLTGDRHSLPGTAVARMILGFIVWSQLAVNWSDRRYTWGDGARWASGVQDARGWPRFLDLFDQVSGRAFDALYLTTIVLGFLLMLGVRTRASAVGTLLLWVSLYVTNPFVGSGGDAVLRMILLYLCFTDSGRMWSVDARRRGRRTGRDRQVVPTWLSTAIHNLALILIIHQVVMVYAGSALWKLQGARWLDGTAIYYPLQTDAYSPWGDLLQPLLTWAPFILGGSYAALLVQLLFPVLLLRRSTRSVALIVITGMHLAIGLLMGLLYFSLVMIAADMILVSDASWRSVLARLRAPTRIGGRVRDGTLRRARDLARR